MEAIELKQIRHLAVGDTIVSASGTAFEVTRLLRVGRGIRVHYLTADGSVGKFTAAPEAISRVRRQLAAAG